MENEELELLDEVSDESDVSTDSLKTDEDSGNEDTQPEQKNKSNFKKLAQAKKELEKELREKDREIEALKEWANSLYDETQEKPFSKKEAQEEKQTNESLDDVFVFYNKNPEAMDFKDEILEAMRDYKCDRNKAWKIVRADLPEESRTKKEFSTAKKTTTTKKALTEYSPEEALKLSKEEQSQWRKAVGWE